MVVAGLAVAAGADRAGHPLVDRGPFALSRFANNPDAAGVAPLRIGMLTSLAVAQTRSGDGDASAKTFAAASALGWRDPAVQAWAAGQALASGQPEIASLRAEALLRGDPDGDLAVAVMTAIAADRDARISFMDRMAQEPTLASTALRTIPRFAEDALDDGVALVETAMASGVRLDAASAALAGSRMAQRDLPAAMSLQVALYGIGGLNDFGFWARTFEAVSASDDARNPFVWTRSETTGAQLESIAGGDGQARLAVSGLAGRPEHLAGIITIVGQERFELAWQASRAGNGGPDLTLDATCAQPAAAIENGRLAGNASGWTRTVSVPTRCKAVQIRVFAPGNGGNSRWLANPRVTPLD